jgi:hypothetical protein
MPNGQKTKSVFGLVSIYNFVFVFIFFISFFLFYFIKEDGCLGYGMKMPFKNLIKV